MTGRDKDKVQPQTDINVPGPDVMLGLWASWRDQMAASTRVPADHGRPWWEMTTDNPAESMLSSGVKQLQGGLSQDPTLRAIDEMWNANPLREVVPIDWAEIARALRTVWLHSLRKPRATEAVTELNQNLWRSALNIWQEAGQRWLGAADLPPARGPAVGATDKRFAAPEWHANPVYRTLKGSIFSPPTGCWSRATRPTWTRPSGSVSTFTFASSWTR
jgi:polyhydroxyalkanoate synthase